MKSFSTAYYISRKESKAEKEALIEQEHVKIVSAMKHEFGINNFGTLTEAEKKSYRSMLNEMWTRENGLTEKGIKFLTEAAAPLTKDSTPEQIEKQFKKEIKANIIALVATLNSDSPSFEHAAKAKKIPSLPRGDHRLYGVLGVCGTVTTPHSICGDDSRL